MKHLLLGWSIVAVAYSAPGTVQAWSVHDHRPLQPAQPTSLLDAPNGERVEPRLIDTPYIILSIMDGT